IGQTRSTWRTKALSASLIARWGGHRISVAEAEAQATHSMAASSKRVMSDFSELACASDLLRREPELDALLLAHAGFHARHEAGIDRLKHAVEDEVVKRLEGPPHVDERQVGPRGISRLGSELAPLAAGR